MQSSKQHRGPPALRLLCGALCAAVLDNGKACPVGTSVVIPIPSADGQWGGQDRQKEWSCPGEGTQLTEGRVDAIQAQRCRDPGPSGHEKQPAQPGLCSSLVTFHSLEDGRRP